MNSEHSSRFLNLSLGMALTGVSCLGFVLPSVMKTNPTVLAHTFSVVTGALLAVIGYFAPLSATQDGVVTIDTFLFIQCCTFLVMFASDHLLGFSVVCSFPHLRNQFNSVNQGRRDDLQFHGNILRSSSIRFSKLETEDILDESLSDSIEAIKSIKDESISDSIEATKSIEMIVTGESSVSQKDAYSLYILIFSEILLGFSKSVHLTSAPEEVSYINVLQYLCYSMIVAYSMSTYLINAQFYSSWLPYFLVILACSPLFAAILLQLPFSIHYDRYTDGVLTSIYCGSALYWIFMCLIPSAVYRQVKEEETGQMILVLIGFSITYYLIGL